MTEVSRLAARDQFLAADEGGEYVDLGVTLVSGLELLVLAFALALPPAISPIGVRSADGRTRWLVRADALRMRIRRVEEIARTGVDPVSKLTSDEIEDLSRATMMGSGHAGGPVGVA